MALIEPSSYRAPLWLRDGHLQTVFASATRKVCGIRYERERLDTTDGDFLDMDWARVGADRVVVVSHGLEGSTQRPYVLGMVRALNRRGWDVATWNFRGCSGESNRQLRFTHSGATDDLQQVVASVMKSGRYAKCGLVGFSLGGNLTLKWLGDLGGSCPDWVLGGVGLSVPVDLRAAADRMGMRANRFYMRRFLGDLRGRLQVMSEKFPNRIDLVGYEGIRDFRAFDERYTAPLHGFRDAEDYWAQSSSLSVLEFVRVPVLLLNAKDDPFLPEACYPDTLARQHPWFTLEVPRWGGHVGFVGGGEGEDYWSEVRTARFLEECWRNRGG